MKKKVILLLIILIPSLIYFMFELSEVNFKKMAYYGPKTVNAKGDTVYYTLPDKAYEYGRVIEDVVNDTVNDIISVKVMSQDSAIKDTAARIVIFFDESQEEKLAGLLEYEKYKKEKLNFLKFVLVKYSPKFPEDASYYDRYLEDSLGINMSNFYLTTVDGERKDFDSIRSYYFKDKPAHVFNYFAVLVDGNRHIRGYYDPSFIAEVKRMIEEYKHLVLKDEHAEMQETNKVEQK